MKILLPTILLFMVIFDPSQSYYARPGNTYFLKKPGVYRISTSGNAYKIICKYVMIAGDSWTPKVCKIFQLKSRHPGIYQTKFPYNQSLREENN